MRALLFAAIALTVFAASASAAAPKCHNITGTCLDHGFVCANNEVVGHAKRCNGIEDCADGTDEFMCNHDDPSPLHLRSESERHAVQQGSCAKCTCVVNVQDVVLGDAWFSYGVASPTDFLGLMTGTGAYRGLPCSPVCAFKIKLAFYKKFRVCRGWLCCARQRECVQCNTIKAGCTTTITANRCYP